MSGACDECGWAEAGGREGCRASFEAFLARDFSDPLYFRTHRMFVDTYCLQHPEQYCASAKSLVAHLAGLCWILEGGAGTAAGPERLRDWLDGARELEKPALPERRGILTLGDLPVESGPAEWADAVRRWAASTWAAYAALHPLARRWRADASHFTNKAR
ncbi:MAG TPA: DUF5946 family protein [Allosphingosinicella sp.]|jgi:hypothetical protein